MNLAFVVNQVATERISYTTHVWRGVKPVQFGGSPINR